MSAICQINFWIIPWIQASYLSHECSSQRGLGHSSLTVQAMCVRDPYWKILCTKFLWPKRRLFICIIDYLIVLLMYIMEILKSCSKLLQLYFQNIGHQKKNWQSGDICSSLTLYWQNHWSMMWEDTRMGFWSNGGALRRRMVGRKIMAV